MASDQMFFDFADVPSVFFGFPFLMGRDVEYPSPIVSDSLTPELEDAYALEVRVRELMHELSAQHNSMLERNDAIQTTFELHFAESVFTVGNVRHFVWSFFRYFHFSFPILHKPTFDLQTASLPLLLTLVLFGTLSSNDSDSSIAIRQFHHIAEAYIFDKLVSWQMLQTPQPAFINNDELELIQASILFVVFLSNVDDLATRRRIRLQRMPSIIAAMRASGLFSYRRRPFITAKGTCDWQAFIADEMRLRLGIWAFIFDATISLFFNIPPQIAAAEMTGSMSCDEDLFRAESAADFERVALLGRSNQEAYTLPGLMSRLLFDPPEEIEDSDNHVSSTEMLILICALMSAIMSARMALVVSVIVEPMLRATDRWKRLWDLVSQDSEGNLLPHIGFEKHAAEYWWLTRTMLRVIQSGDQSCRYLQPVPCDSGHILHDFIRKYKDFSG
ncbi:hypothetical protein ACET3X_002493 [Alternaria dauci]|uniref:Xylanolytic transcriptional activator regulatory domain-containing protein n=1 Tax=Alternaria dauci TaxID=48095 RepID=A0ABR3USP8_9PLEO